MDELHLRRIITGLVSYSLLSALSTTACSSNESTDDGDQHLDVDGGDGAAGNGGTGGGGAGGVQVDGSTAGSGGSTAGSGGSGGSGGMPVSEPFWPDLPLDEFDSPTCAGGEWQATDGLNPANAVDFVALRRIDAFAPTTDAGAVFTEIASTGTPCEAATDVPACEQALSATGAGLELTQSCGGPPFPCQHYLVTTASDTVGRWVTKDDFLTFLGPIDTPAEALLLAFEGTFMGYNVACDAPERTSVRAVDGGFEVVLTHMTEDCAPIVMERDLLRIATDGTITVLRSNIASVSSACVGRRTDGLVSRPEPSGRALGDFFASVAHLEAASVDAFRRLADELAAHGAPAELLSAALDAAADEVRHAGITRRFAERFGGKTVSPSIEPFELRALEELACENAAEGCVRETFGALVAEYQARTARDREVACAMRDIAEDEARHAALAWRVAAWADTLLSSEARERVRRARARAIEDLKRELEADVRNELRTLAGVPEPRVALALAEGLERAVWANPSAVS